MNETSLKFLKDESSFAPNVNLLITGFLRAGGLDITQESISGVGIDCGAHLRGVTAKQYKTINAAAPPSKAGRENSEPRMAGARAPPQTEMSVVTSKSGGAGV